MSKKENGDYSMTEKELRRQHEEQIQDSNDEYWLIPNNEDKTLSEQEEDLYNKQTKADEAYWENKLLEQLETEGKISEDMEEDFGCDEEELDIDDIDLETLYKEDGSVKKDKEDTDDDDDDELEV
ncbi:hypothetical protein QGM71_07405 [Virgibacillus sp. C22-A2]|uniref:Uncharacterized protein n=1 Tax=Virgibacillus tibetensis TaxID=3042313 RepID=A0ABU6KEP7_9BACI|nr:hypothetical protein [Virgibacillus sp. C22-A2]